MVWTIVIRKYGYTIHFLVTMFNMKSHFRVITNGCLVDRGSYSTSDLPAILFYHLKKFMIKLLSYTIFTMPRIYSNKMDVCCIRIRLRQKTDQETDDLILFFSNKTGSGKMVKE